MKKYGNSSPYEKYTKVPGGVCAGFGNFDGVHVGHTTLIKRLTAEASKRGLSSVVYTFEKHPMKIFGDSRKVRLIMTNDRKSEIIEGLGVDGIFFESFDREYASMDCETFARDIVAGKLGAVVAVVGSNYSFGRDGKGTPALLRELGKRYGFEVIEISPVEVDGKVVSSTLLRELIGSGRVDEYPRYAGRSYSIPGKVLHGKELGRSIGFPTANIIPRRGFAIPSGGVYVTRTLIGGVVYGGVTNIGRNPTFGDKKRSIETNLFANAGDLYGSLIEVVFLKKLRGEIKFATPGLLGEQIARDKKEAEKILEEASPEG